MRKIIWWQLGYVRERVGSRGQVGETHKRPCEWAVKASAGMTHHMISGVNLGMHGTSGEEGRRRSFDADLHCHRAFHIITACRAWAKCSQVSILGTLFSAIGEPLTAMKNLLVEAWMAALQGTRKKKTGCVCSVRIWPHAQLNSMHDQFLMYLGTKIELNPLLSDSRGVLYPWRQIPTTHRPRLPRKHHHHHHSPHGSPLLKAPTT